MPTERSPRKWSVRWGWVFVLIGAVGVGLFQLRRGDVYSQPGLPRSEMPLAIQINALSQRAGVFVDGQFASVPVNADDLSLSILLTRENSYKNLPILPKDTRFPTSIHEWFINPDPDTPIAVPIAGQLRGIHISNAYRLTISALADAATSHFNMSFPQTILTIPHRLDEARHLIPEAAAAAGLQSLRVTNEATAAAIGHGLDRTDVDMEEIFILALSVDGGGLASLELLLCEDGVFDKLASVDRIRYTSLQDLLPGLRSAAQQVFDEARIAPAAVHHFLPIGASPDLAPAQAALEEIFNLTAAAAGPPSPADAVIVGAAILAKVFVDDGCDTGCPPIDILPLSLGFEKSSGVMSTVVRRFTIIPTRKEQYILPAFKGQTSFRLRIFLGERALAADNHFLEELEFDMMLPALDSDPAGPGDIAVTFEVDPNLSGVVVLVRDERYGEVLSKTVSFDGIWNALPLEDMIFASEQFAAQDEVLRRLAGDQTRVRGKVGSSFGDE